jgi:hypothetical protein
VEVCRQAAVLAAHEIPAHGGLWQDAIRHTVRALIHRLANARGLREPGLAYHRMPEAEALLDQVGNLADWTVNDLGDVNQELLRLHLVTDGRTVMAVAPRGASKREEQGSWYTPQPVAREMTRVALDAAIGKCLAAQEPGEILRLRVVDPACGAGVFLVEAARKITEAYVARLTPDGRVPPDLAALVLPMVTYECVFGMDIDPVAVDLARFALWAEARGRVPFGWMNGNVACVDPLVGPNSLPERLVDLMGEPPPMRSAAAGGAR